MRFSAFVATVALAVPTAALSLGCAVANLPDESLEEEQASTEAAPARGQLPKRDAGTTPPSSGGGSGGKAGGTTPPAPSPSGTPDAGAPAPTNSCATATSQDACFQCCDVAHPNSLPFLDQAWGDCACDLPGVCASVCANQYCGGQPTLVGGSCDSCLAANDSSCRTKAETKCAADSTCKPYLTCTTDAKCASKAF